MRNDHIVSAEQVKKTIEYLKMDEQLFEVRIVSSVRKKVLSGYFKDSESLLRAFENVDLRGRNIYITLNGLKDSLYARDQHDKFLERTTATTSDTDVTTYDWLFIDVDPVRPAGVSSSNDEFEKSKVTAGKVYRYLKGLGFEEPIKAISGNGCHLLYQIYLTNNQDNISLVHRCLDVLSELFDTDEVKIDTTNYNPSRICKLHGTLAQKGTSTSDRPHRMSYIFSAPEKIQNNKRAFLEKLANEIPEPPKPKTRDLYYHHQKFDLLDFMSKYGLSAKSHPGNNCTIYSLDECPFDRSHTNGDSKIFHYSDGAIAFKCHHNSCSRYKWQDVRLLFEPDAYDSNELDARIDAGWKQHNNAKKIDELNYVPPQSDNPENPMFLTLGMIYDSPAPESEYIKTGINMIDTKLKGLMKKGISVVSGLAGASKSTLMNQIALNGIQEGQRVIYYSGELGKKQIAKWLYLAAAGRNNLIWSKDGYCGVSSENKMKINSWASNSLWIYNNDYGNNFSNISKEIRKKAVDVRADLIIIDNLMALDLSKYDKDKYDAQTQFVWDLKQIANDTNSHVIFVAHPRKQSGFLRLFDIAGSGNIGNVVDNAFIVHRNNQDFKNAFREFYGKNAMIPEGHNIVEIAKNREEGIRDEFISLYFQQGSKRLLNSPTEHIVYGWEDMGDGFSQNDEMEGMPF